MSDNSHELVQLKQYLDGQFAGVYSRIDEIRESHRETREEMIRLRSDFDNHKENFVHHYTPCITSQGVESKISGLKKMMVSMLITSIMVLGGLVTALIAKG